LGALRVLDGLSTGGGGRRDSGGAKAVRASPKPGGVEVTEACVAKGLAWAAPPEPCRRW
jgi:hypothetical protein